MQDALLCFGTERNSKCHVDYIMHTMRTQSVTSTISRALRLWVTLSSSLRFFASFLSRWLSEALSGARFEPERRAVDYITQQPRESAEPSSRCKVGPETIGHMNCDSICGALQPGAFYSFITGRKQPRNCSRKHGALIVFDWLRKSTSTYLALFVHICSPSYHTYYQIYVILKLFSSSDTTNINKKI